MGGTVEQASVTVPVPEDGDPETQLLRRFATVIKTPPVPLWQKKDLPLLEVGSRRSREATLPLPWTGKFSTLSTSRSATPVGFLLQALGGLQFGLRWRPRYRVRHLHGPYHHSLLDGCARTGPCSASARAELAHEGLSHHRPRRSFYGLTSFLQASEKTGISPSRPARSTSSTGDAWRRTTEERAKQKFPRTWANVWPRFHRVPRTSANSSSKAHTEASTATPDRTSPPSRPTQRRDDRLLRLPPAVIPRSILEGDVRRPGRRRPLHQYLREENFIVFEADGPRIGGQRRSFPDSLKNRLRVRAIKVVSHQRTSTTSGRRTGMPHRFPALYPDGGPTGRDEKTHALRRAAVSTSSPAEGNRSSRLPGSAGIVLRHSPLARCARSSSPFGENIYTGLRTPGTRSEPAKIRENFDDPRYSTSRRRTRAPPAQATSRSR